MNFVLLTFIVCLSGISVNSQNCLSRDYGNGGTVCVCNLDHCDAIPDVNKVDSSSFLKFTSNQDGLRFDKEIGTIDSTDIDTTYTIKIGSKQYQEIFGFGGAFTDSTCLNIQSVDEKLQDVILRGYFSKDGIEYNMGRVPMAATDFSTHPYTYHDNEDITLSNFSLAEEDINLKIPTIKKARDLTDGNLHIFTSTWIAPLWMKFNGKYAGKDGYIKQELYQVYADYFIKFLDAYKEHNVSFWGLTTGNEPFSPLLTEILPAVEWNGTEVSKWVANNLGPSLRKSAHSEAKLMILDDQRTHLAEYVPEVLSDEIASSYVDGIAVHWYFDSGAPPEILDEIHFNYSDKFLFYSEACSDFMPMPNHVLLGSWSNGEGYAADIIENLNHWVTGWTDWNMVLDTTGGPTYINNFVDSPTIVNATANEIYRQPMFYVLGHFSKFLTRGSVRVSASEIDAKVPSTAFKRPDGGIAVIILNEKDEDISVGIQDENIDGKIYLNITRRSITSVVYWP